MISHFLSANILGGVGQGPTGADSPPGPRARPLPRMGRDGSPRQRLRPVTGAAA